MPFLLSCATYNSRMNMYYSSVREHNYDKAIRKLDNKFIKRNRNQLLFYMESGRMYRLKNDYVTSNQYFNQADNFIENYRKTAGDVAVSNLVNPMQQTYRGEDFEIFMVHFYKALNYAALGQTDDALVEARRITLSENTQGDKFINKDKRYSADAFALNLQGMIYEMAGDINNAFIAYRNAADVYLKAGGEYYGVTIPEQLKKDLLRTARAMGFGSEAERYAKIFNANYSEESVPASELVLFIEQGMAPAKEERNFVLTNSGSGIGNFTFVDEFGQPSMVNFNYNNYNISADRLSSVRTVRVAVPVYHINFPAPQSVSVAVNGTSYSVQTAQNINSLAVNILRERFLTELTNAIARQVTKKLVEKGTEAATESIAKGQQKKPDANASDAEKEKKNRKNEENAKLAGDVAGLLINLVNTASEKADTRNWQSLPAFVQYVRIPLTDGENTITINANGKSKTVKINGVKGLQLLSEVIE
ncbi:MAG: hypothetical protein JST81_08275 [Bacteroidetes bacterium]|nr:hypothetical protein [Bacteroidota bacterium]